MILIIYQFFLLEMFKFLKSLNVINVNVKMTHWVLVL